MTKKEQAAKTEVWLPEVSVIQATPIPSDADILFNGYGTDAWEHKDGTPIKWINEKGVLTVSPKSGAIQTKQAYCDVQLHLEWRSPNKIKGKSGQLLGNSGVFLQSLYEVQVLDSYNNKTYANGQAGSIYKQSPPLVNAMRPTGEWQTYDIIFQAPRFDGDFLLSKAKVTVLHNGILIQNNTVIEGPTVYIGQPKYKAHGCQPLMLQDHSDKVSFRNIWIRSL